MGYTNINQLLFQLISQMIELYTVAVLYFTQMESERFFHSSKEVGAGHPGSEWLQVADLDKPSLKRLGKKTRQKMLEFLETGALSIGC